MFGRFISGKLLLRHDAADGYLPVVDTPLAPVNGYSYSYHYEEQDEQLVQVWDAAADDTAIYTGPEAEIPDAEALRTIIGDRHHVKRRYIDGFRGQLDHATGVLTDADALGCMELYREWQPGMVITKENGIWYLDGVAMGADLRLRCNGKLWRVNQPHTTQEGWEPGINTASLFSLVALPADGTEENPIAFVIGMVLEQGRYYREDEKLYYCYNGSGANPTAYSLIYYGAFVQEVTA